MRSLALAGVMVAAACGGDGQLPADAPVADAFVGNDTPAAAALAITPANVDFGSIMMSTHSAPAHLTVANVGGSTTTLAVSTGGDFAIDATSCTSSLAPGATCTVDVVATPQVGVPGARTGTLTAIGSSVVVMATAELLVQAITNENHLIVGPAMNDFGDLIVGQTSASFAFTFTNPGGTAISGLVLTPGGADPTQFTVASNTCGTLAPATTCTVGIAFAPTTTGAKAASFTVANATLAASAYVTGNALAAPAALAITPAVQDFGSIGAGTTSNPVVFTIANTGGTPATSLVVASSTQVFPLIGTTCGTLAAGASCTATVRFAPVVPGAQAGTLDVTGTGVPPAHAGLQGTGINADNILVMSPSPVDFGAVVIGQTASQVFTVTNIGGTPQPALAFAFTGPAAAELSLAQDMCTGVALAPGGFCTVAAVFAPASVGLKQAVLAANATAAYAGILGSGIATPTTLASAPSSASFGNWGTGTTSFATTFTVTNHGATATAALATSLAGADASQFALTADACAGAMLAAGATCTVGVVFSPTTTGGKTATVQVSGGAGALASSYVAATGF